MNWLHCNLHCNLQRGAYVSLFDPPHRMSRLYSEQTTYHLCALGELLISLHFFIYKMELTIIPPSQH